MNRFICNTKTEDSIDKLSVLNKSRKSQIKEEDSSEDENQDYSSKLRKSIVKRPSSNISKGSKGKLVCVKYLDTSRSRRRLSPMSQNRENLQQKYKNSIKSKHDKGNDFSPFNTVAGNDVSENELNDNSQASDNVKFENNKEDNPKLVSTWF